MKTLNTSLLLLFLSFCAFSQTKDIKVIEQQIKTFKNNRYYEIAHRQPENTTFVTFYGAPLGGRTKLLFNSSPVAFGTEFSFAGEHLQAAPEKIDLILAVRSQNNSMSNLQGRTIYLLADGERLDLTGGKSEVYSNRGNVGTSRFGGAYMVNTEKISFKLNRRELEKVAAARASVLVISGQKYELSAAQQQVLKDILTISQI